MSHVVRPAVRGVAAALALAVLAAACASEAPSAPAMNSATNASAALHAVDLGTCPQLAVGDDEAVAAHVYASGYQMYRWTGSSWFFTGPVATLSADPDGRSQLGRHYVGPTWVSNSGSGVVGRLAVSCTPDANAIPWLLLNAVSSRGPGIFEGTTHIQRINTVGGLPPAFAGDSIGQKELVPYTAEYVFYKAR